MPRDSGETPIPTEELGAPARRALEGAGYTTLGQLAEVHEAEVRGLHGGGPNALDALREVLEAHDLSIAGSVWRGAFDVFLEREAELIATFPNGGLRARARVRG